jgi:hypothetical protein
MHTELVYLKDMCGDLRKIREQVTDTQEMTGL